MLIFVLKRKYPRAGSMKATAEKRNGGILPSNRVIMSVKEKKDPNRKSDYMIEKERQEKIVNEAGTLTADILGDRIKVEDLPF